ncbi:MAG: hypothetical protein ACMXYD_04440 [Candidatus Woesearchaeota archaeon]
MKSTVNIVTLVCIFAVLLLGGCQTSISSDAVTAEYYDLIEHTYRNSSYNVTYEANINSEQESTILEYARVFDTSVLYFPPTNKDNDYARWVYTFPRGHISCSSTKTNCLYFPFEAVDGELFVPREANNLSEISYKGLDTHLGRECKHFIVRMGEEVDEVSNLCFDTETGAILYHQYEFIPDDEPPTYLSIRALEFSVLDEENTIMFPIPYGYTLLCLDKTAYVSLHALTDLNKTIEISAKHQSRLIRDTWTESFNITLSKGEVIVLKVPHSIDQFGRGHNVTLQDDETMFSDTCFVWGETTSECALFSENKDSCVAADCLYQESTALCRKY